MNKREFLAAAAVAGALPLAPARAAADAVNPTDGALGGPALLTVTGALERANRGPFDPALDQMMAKHGVAFARAFVFDAPALQRLPAVTIRPTLEYDARMHALSGPLLATVLEAAGAASDGALQLGLRAIDGYNVELSLADARRYRMIVATHIEGRPLALGGLGPQWAVHEADTLAPFRDKPLAERFALCPWGLYHIEVKRG